LAKSAELAPRFFVPTAVIASAAKQSISPRRKKLDCFASLAMTAEDVL
jgi:hypothetical protein